MNFQKHIELFQAIQSGSLDKVKSILEELDNKFEQNILCRVIRYLKSFVEVEHTLDSPCGDGRYQEFAGFTPLEFAIKNANSDIVKLLLERGVNLGEISCIIYEGDKISVRHGVPLITSIESGSLEIVQLLLTYGANLQEIYFPLRHAVKGNNSDIVKLFLENGQKPSHEWQWYQLLEIAVENKNKKVLKVLINDSEMILRPFEARQLLYKAVEKNNVDIVKFLLDEGFSANSHTLFPAIDKRNLEMLQLLLNHGFNDDINRRIDNYNKPPLYKAIELGYFEGVKCILENGADMNKRLCWPFRSKVDKKENIYRYTDETPLELALRLEHDSIADLLSHWQEQSMAEDTSKDEQKLLLGDGQVDWEMIG